MLSRLKEIQASNDDNASTDSDSTYEDEQLMPEFFGEVNSCKKKLHSIERNIKQINELGNESLTAVGSRSQGISTTLDPYELEISESLNEIVQNTNLLATEMRNYLKQMDKNSQESKVSNPTELRIKKTVHNSLVVNFLKVMKDYRDSQERFDTILKGIIKRRYITAKPTATEEEIEQAIASKNTNVFSSLILEDKRKKQAVEALNYIEAKHKDILILEESVLELQQLFHEVAILVDYQGEIIDEIQVNVVDSANNTKKAAENITKAQKDQKKARKKKMWILGLVAGIGVLSASGGTIGGVLAH